MLRRVVEGRGGVGGGPVVGGGGGHLEAGQACGVGADQLAEAELRD